MERELKILVSGDSWVKLGFDTFVFSFIKLIRNSKSRLVITAYILNEKRIFHELKKAIKSGISVDIYMDYSLNKCIIEELEHLEKNFSNLRLRIIKDSMLHAKILVADGKRCIVGSANITKGGFYKNYELGILIENKRICHDIEKIIMVLG